MVEGESGILNISPAWNRPEYEPSKRRLTWPNGAIATCFSADEPERLRGPQFDAAWCDEVAAWRYPLAWDMLMFGLRLGTNPRCVITTTPKPTKLIRELLARKDVAVTRGSTKENAANLAPAFLNQIMGRYAGTRLGRQELDAELLDDVPGALWTHDVIDRARIAQAPQLVRIVVAIDPSGSGNDEADECGITVAGSDGKGHGYVLEDLSGRFAPTEWAQRAIAAYHRHKADRIVAEINFGGQMVEATLRAVDPSIPFTAITASRGKVLRAEPVSAFYEQSRVHHVGSFAELEDQMCGFASNFNRATAGYSPDRVDALCFAVTELLGGTDLSGWVEFYRLEATYATGQAPRPTTTPTTENNMSIESDQTVTMKAPRPWASFYINTRLHTADNDGLIEDVQPEHVKALRMAGCKEVVEAQTKGYFDFDV